MEALVGCWKSVGCEGVLLKPYFGCFFTLFHSFVGVLSDNSDRSDDAIELAAPR